MKNWRDTIFIALRELFILRSSFFILILIFAPGNQLNKYMLHGHFFTIEACEPAGNSAIVKLKLNEDHEVFRGHFPGQPVVPGVFTLQLIKECIQYLTGKRWQYEEVQNCKFSHPILPGQSGGIWVETAFEAFPDDRRIRLKAAVKAGEQHCFSLKAILKEAAE